MAMAGSNIWKEKMNRPKIEKFPFFVFQTTASYSGSSVCVDISTVSVVNKWHVHLQPTGETSKLSV